MGLTQREINLILIIARLTAGLIILVIYAFYADNVILLVFVAFLFGIPIEYVLTNRLLSVDDSNGIT